MVYLDFNWGILPKFLEWNIFYTDVTDENICLLGFGHLRCGKEVMCYVFTLDISAINMNNRKRHRTYQDKT